MLNRVVFEVVRTWKGANAERLEVRTSQSSASCGYGFEVGQSYLVYTYDADGEEHTGLCGRNAPMESESAAADVAAMGAGVTPVEPARERESDVPVAPRVEEPPPLEQRSGGCASCTVGPSESAPANGSLGALGLFVVAFRVRRRVRRSGSSMTIARAQPL
jgi:MYXO-CTERM domain-containing protein